MGQVKGPEGCRTDVEQQQEMTTRNSNLPSVQKGSSPHVLPLTPFWTLGRLAFRLVISCCCSTSVLQPSGPFTCPMIPQNCESDSASIVFDHAGSRKPRGNAIDRFRFPDTPSPTACPPDPSRNQPCACGPLPPFAAARNDRRSVLPEPASSPRPLRPEIQ